MLQAQWKSEVQLNAGTMRAEVGAFEWPHPAETYRRLDQPRLSLSLTPRPPRSRMRYEGTRDTAFTDIGDLIFLPSSIPFIGRCDGGHQRLLTCSFAMPALETRSVNDWTEAELIAGLDLKDAKLRSTLARIAQELLNPGLASTMLVEALLITATIDLMRFLDGRRRGDEIAKGGLAPWQLRRIRERVEQPDAPAPSIDELAKLVGISARHLMRGFKKSSGTTLHGYVEQVRLDRAKSFLLKTDLPLKTISWKLGFAHASSFSAAFQRALGLSPTAFRAQSSRDGG
jgi:AraC family transcriptional regulator